MLITSGAAFDANNILDVIAHVEPGESVDLTFKGQGGEVYHVTLELSGCAHVMEACMRAVHGTELDLVDQMRPRLAALPALA